MSKLMCLLFLLSKGQKYVCVQAHLLMYVLFLYPKVKYKFVQAHVYAVFAIKKLNICVSKLMCVLFLCARQ